MYSFYEILFFQINETVFRVAIRNENREMIQILSAHEKIDVNIKIVQFNLLYNFK